MYASRDGFTLVEIMVVLALVVVLAALVAPGMIGQIDRARVDRTAESLLSIGDAIHDPSRGGGSFRGHVGVYPGALSHLTRQITIVDVNSCGLPYTPEQAASWNGPYLGRAVGPGGIPLPVGSAADTLVRELDGPNADPVLEVAVRDVAPEDAEALDLAIDGAAGPDAGGIRWGAPDADGFVTVEYLVPMKGC